MNENGIGASVREAEQRFLIGKGNYTDDIDVAGQTHAVFVRSPHAHAGIKGIDCSDALAAPGVVAVLTGDDLAADGIGLICGVTVTSDDGEPIGRLLTLRWSGRQLCRDASRSSLLKRALRLVMRLSWWMWITTFCPRDRYRYRSRLRAAANP